MLKSILSNAAHSMLLKKVYIDVMYNHNIYVVRPCGVHLIPPCSAFNEDCSIVENKHGNGALIKYVVTGTTQQS